MTNYKELRELDEWIFQSVFGAKRGKKYGNGNGEWIVNGKSYPEAPTWDTTPRYTRDPAACIELQKKILDSQSELGFGDPIISRDGKNYWVRTVRDGQHVEGEAETLELCWSRFARKLFSTLND